ncbi:MAG: hypothetical protein IJS60_02290 [Abditibacteriota bacterium]|nr:hypothetical protein [Abditibacteriota bacterium]
MLLNIKKNRKLVKIKENSFDSEKDLQKLCEKNLDVLLNLKFICSEFKIEDCRFDTIALDEELKSFVIIEYKNVSDNVSVVDQGCTYKNKLLNHKADIVLFYNNQFNCNNNIDYYDWSSTKIIFIAPDFNKYQQGAIENNVFNIEFYKIIKFDNHNILFEPVGNNKINQKLNVKVEKKQTDIEEQYTEDDIIKLSNPNEKIRDFYYELKDFILGMHSDINIYFTKIYVGFKYENKILFTMETTKNQLNIWYNNKSNLKNELIEDVSGKGHHGIGDYHIKIRDKNHFNEIKDIIQQEFDFIKQI